MRNPTLCRLLYGLGTMTWWAVAALAVAAIRDTVSANVSTPADSLGVVAGLLLYHIALALSIVAGAYCTARAIRAAS